MSGIKCSIHSCHVSRRPKYKSMRIFKIPCGDLNVENSCRNKFVGVARRDF